MDIDILKNMLYATGTTMGFAIVLQSHKRYLWLQGVIGTVGWIIFMWVKQQPGHSSFDANFLGAFSVALLGELMAMVVKQPATVLVIPGIFPLVPGLGMYLGMSKLLERSYQAGFNVLITAAGDAAAIALGIMMITSLFRVGKILLKPTNWGRPL